MRKASFSDPLHTRLFKVEIHRASDASLTVRADFRIESRSALAAEESRV